MIDDASQNINTIIRGSDLIDSSSRQIYLQKILSLPKVAYGHVPVATLNQKKLSKENQSMPINISNIKDNLIACLKFLGQDYEVVRKENIQIETDTITGIVLEGAIDGGVSDSLWPKSSLNEKSRRYPSRSADLASSITVSGSHKVPVTTRGPASP